MKKQLLFSTSLLVTGLLSAQVANKASKIPAHLANISAKKNAKVDEQNSFSNLSFQAKAIKANKKNNYKVSAITSHVLGGTAYDLQSNSSVGDRIVVNNDGTIAACWTFATPDGGTYADRGTGYAYYNGTTWSAAPTVRVENTRVGWGNIVNTRSGNELILSHAGSLKLLNVASRPTKGTGTWANSTTAIPSANSGGNFWPRMVTSSVGGGDTIYAIAVTSNAAGGGTAYNGLDGAVVFSRSKDAGATWDIVNMIPAGLTSATFTGFGGDSYAIAAKGSTVAIIAGDSGKDLVLTKSTDAGATWTSKTVLKFPLPLWDYTTTTTDINSDGVADTVATNDGNLSVVLDNTGKAYVAYGAQRILNDAPSASGYSYFPYTDGLYLWDESMPQNAGGNIVAAIQDLGEQGTIYFPTPAATGDLAFGRWSCSLTSYPSMAFDASNTLYLSYSSIVDSLFSVTNPLKLVRHTYVIKSTNGGATFTDPYELDQTTNAASDATEGIFGSMAKNVDGYVHIVYQRDLFPGNGIPPAAGSTNPDSDNLDQPNDIVYVKIPVAEIVGNAGAVGVKELTSIASLGFYPNPASSNATITVDLKDNAKMEISILNAVGQTVYSTSVNGNMGNNKVDVNLNNLSAGLYFYQVKVGNAKAITQKFAVEK